MPLGTPPTRLSVVALPGPFELLPSVEVTRVDGTAEDVPMASTTLEPGMSLLDGTDTEVSETKEKLALGSVSVRVKSVGRVLEAGVKKTEVDPTVWVTVTVMSPSLDAVETGLAIEMPGGP